MAISWDLEYGPVIPAHHSYGWEKLPPESLTRLDVSTAAFLKQMMDQISAGWEIGEVLTNDTLIIWVIDMAGQIWFAMEELVLNGEPRGIPKHQKMELTAAADKLGHPALVGCAAARIAGEIFFDPTRPPPLWVMNNKSRRYGVLPSPFRKDSHLKNAAKQFALFGIDLDTEFLPGLPI